MTDYNTNMTSTEQIPTPELFELRKGIQTAYYTSYPEALLFNGHIYTPASIKRGDYTVDSNLNTVSVTLTAAVLAEFGIHVANNPSQRTRVIIYRTISDDMSEYRVVFDGHITGIVFNDKDVATVRVDQQASILDRQIDMFVHQATCNHHVFDRNCSLDYLLWVETTVVIVNGSTLFADVFDTYEDGYFTGGEVHFIDDARLITNHVGGDLTLHIPFSGDLITGMEVVVYPGCNGTPDTCINKFNNYSNFLGFPYIPNKNPAIWGV